MSPFERIKKLTDYELNEPWKSIFGGKHILQMFIGLPIAFLLFAFFLGFAIMIGAELNAAIEEEWPAPPPHLQRWRQRTQRRRQEKSARSEPNGQGTDDRQSSATEAGAAGGKGHPEPAAVSPS